MRFESFRHGVIPLSTPRVAAGNAFEAQPRATEGAMKLDGLQTILRAAGFETAAAARTAYKMQKRPQRPTIQMDEKNHGRFHLGAWQNRKPPRQKQPFLTQFGVAHRGRRGFCDGHHQPAGGNTRAFLPADLPHPAADEVPNHRATDPFGRDKTKARVTAPWLRDHAQTQKPPLNRAAFLANEGEFPAEPDARRVRKPEAIRPRCGGRNGFRHPSAGGACDHVAGGG